MKIVLNIGFNYYSIFFFLNVGFRVSGVSRENAISGLKPDTRNLKPMLGEGFIAPDNLSKRAIFIANYEV
jgi:hypothetical protein